MINFILPKFQFRVEKWKWNKEFRIYVSNLGNFKDEHKNNVPIKINNGGYVMVKTPYGHKSAHRLVMLTFKPIPNAEDLTIDHLNHNKRENSVSNLEWVTQEENLLRAKKDFINIVPNEENFNIAPNKAQLISVVQSGKSTFKDIEEAAKFCQNAYNMKNVSIETIIKRINNAIKNNHNYCGRKWKVGIVQK